VPSKCLYPVVESAGARQARRPSQLAVGRIRKYLRYTVFPDRSRSGWLLMKGPPVALVSPQIERHSPPLPADNQAFLCLLV
jgi:hypothetical protein